METSFNHSLWRSLLSDEKLKIRKGEEEEEAGRQSNN